MGKGQAYNNAIKSQLQRINASESNPHGFRRVGPQTVGGSASADFDRFWPVWAVFASFECRSWAAQRASPKGGASEWKAPAAASKGAIEFATPKGVRGHAGDRDRSTLPDDAGCHWTRWKTLSGGEEGIRTLDRSFPL